LRGLTTKSVRSYKYSDKGTKIGVNVGIWAITKLIFSYTGSPQVKILQKVLGGATFLTRTVDHKL